MGFETPKIDDDVVDSINEQLSVIKAGIDEFNTSIRCSPSDGT